jgi:N-glycosylase/DNA lyase
MMNKWDLDNLEFLLTLDTQEFDEWMEQADSDDIEYALQLIRNRRTEIAVEEMDLCEVQEFYEKKSDFSEALEVINRIKNVGKI